MQSFGILDMRQGRCFWWLFGAFLAWNGLISWCFRMNSGGSCHPAERWGRGLTRTESKRHIYSLHTASQSVKASFIVLKLGFQHYKYIQIPFHLVENCGSKPWVTRAEGPEKTGKALITAQEENRVLTLHGRWFVFSWSHWNCAAS